MRACWMCWTLTCWVLTLASVAAGDWRQFRGPSGSAVADTEGALSSFARGDAVVWKTALPGRGLSSPIVVGDRVFVTCASGPGQEKLHIICIGTGRGQVVWQRTFWATGRTMTHNKTNVAAPTPCSDGESVFALFSSNDLFRLDLDGNLKWLRGLTYDYPNASNSLGLASSPVLAESTLIVQIENDSESFAAGIDVDTGLNRWRIERPKAANWTSPGLLRGAAATVALQSSKGVLAIDPETGKELWNYAEGAATIPSPVFSGGVLYVPSFGITALQPSPAGERVPKILWRNEQANPATGTPVVTGGKIYFVKGGILTVLDAASGERLRKTRVKGGAYSASPLAAGDYLYLFNEQGFGQIIDISPEGEGQVISEIELGETILCTPAIARGAIYLRSDQYLWKLAES